MAVDLSEFYTNEKKICIIGRYIQTLSEEDVEKIEAAFKTDDIANRAIVQWLNQKISKPTSEDSLRNHRWKRCICNA